MNCLRTPVKLRLQVCRASELSRPVSTVPTVKKLTVKNFQMRKLSLQ